MLNTTTARARVAPTRLGPAWAQLEPLPGFLLSAVLVAIVATIDYSSGYEARLAILYVIPIAIATWTGGGFSGLLICIASAACWVVSFRTMHEYSKEFYFFWEGAVLVIFFCGYVALLSRLKKALIRADQRFFRVVEGFYAGVMVTDDATGEVLYANHRLSEMTDLDAGSLTAASFASRFTYLESPATLSPDPAFARSGASATEVREAHDAVAGRWVLISSGPVPWDHRGGATLKVVTDISARKHAEMVKRQHQDNLHQITHFAALAEIASMLAHEINQPLMAISSYQEACMLLLGRQQPDIAEVIATLQKSRDQTVRAGRIIDGTRDFLRRRMPSQSGVDLNLAVRAAVQATELDLIESSTEIDFRLATSLPEGSFDQTLIVQVIFNLLRNAIESMYPVDRAARNLRISTCLDDEQNFVVTVSDRGNGLTAENEQQLYTPFHTTKTHGLGLGLCICRTVIEAHAGRMIQYPNPDGGMTFGFILPPGQMERSDARN